MLFSRSILTGMADGGAEMKTKLVGSNRPRDLRSTRSRVASITSARNAECAGPFRCRAARYTRSACRSARRPRARSENRVRPGHSRTRLRRSRPVGRRGSVPRLQARCKGIQGLDPHRRMPVDVVLQRRDAARRVRAAGGRLDVAGHPQRPTLGARSGEACRTSGSRIRRRRGGIRKVRTRQQGGAVEIEAKWAR